ncbi:MULTISPECIES: hypothetical protein [Candidatus Ichthyocystis]|nr:MULTISPECIES: hypothetical protein [Ichthyocystis]
MSACSEAFWDSVADDAGSYQQRSFYGQIKRVSTVYYSESGLGSGNTAEKGALLGAIVGGLAGAGMSNGSGVGTIVGAGAGAAIGGAAVQNNVRDSDFSENSKGKRATRLVVLKEDGDRVVIIQRFTNAFIPGDRVKVSVFRDGSTRIKRVVDQRGERHRRHHYDDDDEDFDDHYYGNGSRN